MDKICVKTLEIKFLTPDGCTTIYVSHHSQGPLAVLKSVHECMIITNIRGFLGRNI